MRRETKKAKPRSRPTPFLKESFIGGNFYQLRESLTSCIPGRSCEP